MARRRMGFGRTTGDEPVKTKTNRGRSTTTRRTARSLPRNVAKEMDPKGPPKGTESSLERSKPTADPMTVTKTATKPKVDAKTTPKVAAPPKVTKRPKVTGEGTDKASRNVSREGAMGKRTLANVTREQLVAAGLTTGPKGLNTYLNKFDELGRRPKPSDFKKPAEMKNKPTSPASARGRGIVRKAKGGMMKSKMKAKGMKAGGKMKTKGYMAGGLKDAPEGNTGLKKLPKQVRNKMGFKAKGGMMKTKGYAKGGMKSKGYAKGGKVRGAGIARKGVRPAKMR